MVGASFHNLIASFDAMNSDQYNELVEITQNYPYFPTAWAYLAKASVAQKKLDAEKCVERAAILAHDRGILKDWLEENNQHLSIVSQEVEVQSKEDKPQKAEAKTEKKKAPKKTTKSKASKPKKESQPASKSISRQEKNAQQMRSFMEWLDYETPTTSDALEEPPITNTSEVAPKDQKEGTDKWAMIDAFIENNPKISNPDALPQKTSEEPSINLAADQTLPQEELMTETLAKILMAQHKYSKALQAYKILSLKYPEKNTFFASQIKEIKRLQQAK